MKRLFFPAAVLFTSVALAAGQPPRLNIIFITADDMNYDSAGCTGCPIKDLTPNVDRLASEGMRFQYAYSTVAVCQPVREIMHTGLYPQHNGAMGFLPLKPEVRTVNQQLHDAGYLISMIGKEPHYQPAEKFCVDFSPPLLIKTNGMTVQAPRSPGQLYLLTKEFLKQAADQGKPFFHHVNCTDPHRPFIGYNGPDDLAHGEPPSRWIQPDELKGVPGFLEDLPKVRKEIAQYLTSVRRLDDCLGAILKALDESGQRENTLVMFYGGDHGMSFPFAKSNDYENSSRGTLILRWPGVTKPGSVDTNDLVSTIDFTPTLLDATALPMIPHMDGRSFLPALKGEKMSGWDKVFTFYNQTSAKSWLLMRCIRTKDRSYIWNAWADGQTEYHAENMAGLTWKAMVAAAQDDPAINGRVDFYLHRVPEEFYDLTQDRVERKNLIADPAHQQEIATMRGELLDLLRRSDDPLAEAFAHRDNPQLLRDAEARLIAEYPAPAKGKGGGKGKKNKVKAPQSEEE
jgi:N-sulfoglucosamine sulfohydrolase